jgi:hypothetical protein
MKKQIVALLLITQSLMASPAGQLSSLTTQSPTSAGTNLVKMDIVDELVEMGISPDKTKIIIKEDGIYLFIASGQVGATASGASGYMDLWFIKNGKPVPNSNCRQMIPDSTWTGTVSTQVALTLKAGDTVSLGYSASAPSLGFIFTQPDNEPAIPSFLLAITWQELPTLQNNSAAKKLK